MRYCMKEATDARKKMCLIITQFFFDTCLYKQTLPCFGGSFCKYQSEFCNSTQPSLMVVLISVVSAC